MIFEWDEEKDKTNQRKHGIAFKDAKYVFADPFAISREDYTEKENRKQIMGHVYGDLLIILVFTMIYEFGEYVIRIISARKATAAERRAYEKGKWF